MRYGIDLVRLAGADLQAEVLAAAEKVLLRYGTRKREFFGARKAGPQHQVAGGFFLDLDLHVDLVCGSGDGRGFHRNILEIAQPIDPRTRLVDFFAVVPTGFRLAHFAANHLVASPRVARHVDATHIDPASRINEHGERHQALFLVQFGCGIDVGKGIAFIAQAIADGFGCLGHVLAREHLAGLDLYQPGQFLFRQQQLAGQLDRGNGVLFTLGNIDGDVDVLLVR